MTARVLALWCMDWPAVAAAAAAGLPATTPVAVTLANRVVACSAAAREAGVRRGLRRREAQARCPGVHIVTADPARDARFFEAVTTAVDDVVPRAEVLRPGLLVLPVRGAARYFGSEEAAAERLVDAVAAAGAECQTGVADQLATAVFAARAGRVVPPGRDAEFLSGLSIRQLPAEPGLSGPGRGELADLLWRLGVRTFGQFAALPRPDVASRFGADAVVAHRMVCGEPDRAPSGQELPADLDAVLQCDPPIERVDAAAFAGRTLAAALHRSLEAAGVGCTRLAIHAVTAGGGELSRVWRCAEPLTEDATADRVRWQLDGWLASRRAGAERLGEKSRRAGAQRLGEESRRAGAQRLGEESRRAGAQRLGEESRRAGAGPTGPVVMLRLEPVEVVSAEAMQLPLWGGPGEENRIRARRALVRVQGLLGAEAVQLPVLSGGRGPAERITLIPIGDEAVPRADPDRPWPGCLPEPAPTVLPEGDSVVELLDAQGNPVRVNGRGMFTSEPARLHGADTAYRGNLSWWTGPWPVDERWWDQGDRHSRGGPTARAQVLLDTDPPRALLLCYRLRRWYAEGVYE